MYICSVPSTFVSGGKVDLFPSASESSQKGISGIFIKHVLDGSPAGRNGTLKTGDRILEVRLVETVTCMYIYILVELLMYLQSPAGTTFINTVYFLFVAHAPIEVHPSFFQLIYENFC